MDEFNCGQKIDADKAILHMNFSNRRMLIALITVCVTFIVTIIVFTCAFTAREKNWLDATINIKNRLTEVENGMQQADDRADP
jgi:heme/copper-type cytochrome/quinol oxidase subunit 2